MLSPYSLRRGGVTGYFYQKLDTATLATLWWDLLLYREALHQDAAIQAANATLGTIVLQTQTSLNKGLRYCIQVQTYLKGVLRYCSQVQTSLEKVLRYCDRWCCHRNSTCFDYCCCTLVAIAVTKCFSSRLLTR